MYLYRKFWLWLFGVLVLVGGIMALGMVNPASAAQSSFNTWTGDEPSQPAEALIRLAMAEDDEETEELEELSLEED